LGEICAALRKGGVLSAAVPQHPSLWSESDVLASHIQRYRMGEVEKKARAAGFEVRFADSFVSLLLPAMALSRIMSRITLGQKRDDTTRGRKDPVGRELRIGPSLNRVMRAILRLEHLLRRVGLRSPIGGSRVIVAQKLG
jgi:hypothetical protein